MTAKTPKPWSWKLPLTGVMAALVICLPQLLPGQAAPLLAKQGDEAMVPAVSLVLRLKEETCSLTKGCDIVVTIANNSNQQIRFMVTNGTRIAFRDFTLTVKNAATKMPLLLNANLAEREWQDKNGIRHPVTSSMQSPRLEPGEAYTEIGDLARALKDIGSGTFLISVQHPANQARGWASVTSNDLEVAVRP